MDSSSKKWVYYYLPILCCCKLIWLSICKIHEVKFNRMSCCLFPYNKHQWREKNPVELQKWQNTIKIVHTALQLYCESSQQTKKLFTENIPFHHNAQIFHTSSNWCRSWFTTNSLTTNHKFWSVRDQLRRTHFCTENEGSGMGKMFLKSWTSFHLCTVFFNTVHKTLQNTQVQWSKTSV